MRTLFPAVIAAALAASGCNVKPVESAPVSGTPPVSYPVGQLPGGVPQPVSPDDPFANNAVALAEGRKLFVRYNCYGCHGGHAGGGMGPSLRDQDWIYGNSPDNIFESIAQGRANGMPSWGERIPDEQVWKLVAYIRSMRTSQEPDPPE